MLQEIITYIIIFTAVLISFYRMHKKLSVKKNNNNNNNNNKEAKINYQASSYTPQHNCNDCIADCSIRDAVPAIRKRNEEVCETTVKKATTS